MDGYARHQPKRRHLRLWQGYIVAPGVAQPLAGVRASALLGWFIKNSSFWPGTSYSRRFRGPILWSWQSKMAALFVVFGRRIIK